MHDVEPPWALLAARRKRIEEGRRQRRPLWRWSSPQLDARTIRRAVHEGDPWSGHMALPGAVGTPDPGPRRGGSS